MAKVSQRFWSLIVFCAGLLTLGAGCGRNDVPIWGGVGVGGTGSSVAGTGNRAGTGNVGNFAGFGNFGGVGASAGAGASAGSGGFNTCGDSICGLGESMENCIF